MDDQSQRSPVAGLRSSFTSRAAGVESRVQAPEELPNDPESGTETPAAPSRRRTKVNTSSQFSGPLTPGQFKLPADLLQSLKLHAIDTGESMSEIVLRCLTSPDTIEKAWISTRKAS